MTAARVTLWGSQIGAVEWDEERERGVFQYTPDFSRSRIQVAPIMMPLQTGPYSFSGLPENFRGLPGLLADSLPDRFGHRLIDAWLAAQGREPGSMNPVERLCYIGQRGMGALEFKPHKGPSATRDELLDIERLAILTNEVLSERENLTGHIGGNADGEALQDILRVGTSAGGARAKALIAWNAKTGEFRSGQTPGKPGFEYWLLKFDGIDNNRDRELADPQGYGQVEYAYALMAQAAGITMAPCRLHKEGGRSHFMTRRFDRTDQGKKLHMQSLAALCHYDYNDPASYSYEQAFQVIRRLSASAQADLEQQFLRAVFNLVARNQDDHVKNIAFLMRPDGKWRLSPAFDITYAWNQHGTYTSRQQMSVNGKRDNFRHEDLLALADAAGLKAPHARKWIYKLTECVARWAEFAEKAGISASRIERIAKAHRLKLTEE